MDRRGFGHYKQRCMELHGAFRRGQDQTERGLAGRQTSAAPFSVSFARLAEGVTFKLVQEGGAKGRNKPDEGMRWEPGEGRWWGERKERAEHGPSVGVGDRQPGLEPTLYSLLHVRLWAAHLASWSLCFPICQTGAITVPTSRHRED